MAENLPAHLKKYIVEQNDNKYTPIDHACWRYILRQLRSFLSVHAHESYLDGLDKTGVTVDRIPKISDISKHLEKFGWRALPVSGFIPPAAFMELQSLGVLPIASDMRTIEHVMYTPAPDIVHEAAGHAPLLANKEFSDYLKKYAQVARKALISKEDLDVYSAIRDLSDIKEHPQSTPEQISAAQKHLEKVSTQISHISEASLLSRMNWWTAEYGLIGSLENPKIFGAGLLSSVGESKWCLSNNVKKIPLTIDCINQSYDITEPQPQLFVTPDFKTLSRVLDELADQMAFKVGKIQSVRKAIQAQTVNTIELNTGLQISGICTNVVAQKNASEQIAYIQFNGPTQLCYQDQQLDGHGKDYHQHGYGTALGPVLLKEKNVNLSSANKTELEALGLIVGKNCTLNFSSGICVQGQVDNLFFNQQKLLLVAFSNCTVTDQQTGQKFFEPAWGTYDMSVGEEALSVYAGPADRKQFGEAEDFVTARVPQKKYSEQEIRIHKLYQSIRDLRENNNRETTVNQLQQLFVDAKNFAANEWLLYLEIYELILIAGAPESLQKQVLEKLYSFNENSSQKQMIEEGLALIKKI